MTENTMAMGIDIKQLYRVEVQETVRDENGKPRKVNEHDYSYKMIYDSGIDGGWAKYRDDTEVARLFLLPSANKYYVMDVSSKKKLENPVPMQLTEDLLKTFLNKASSDYGLETKHSIFNIFFPGKNWCEHFVSLLGLPEFPDVCKSGLFTIKSVSNSLESRYCYTSDLLPKIGKVNSKLVKYVISKAKESGITEQRIRQALQDRYNSTDKLCPELVRFFECCQGLYGYDTTVHKFVDKWFDDLDITLSSGYGGVREDAFCELFGRQGGQFISGKNYNGDLEAASHDGWRVFDAEVLSNYLIYKSKRQGVLNLEKWIGLMKDSYSSQEQLYGRIKEKYPEALATYHDQISYKNTIRKYALQDEQYLKKQAAAKVYEGTYDKYILKSLETAGDVVDEATQMANCVKSYIQHVIDGDCYLMGLRYEETPDESLVTVEIRNHEPVQMYREHNTPITNRDRRAIWTIMKRYYDANKLTALAARAKSNIENATAAMKASGELKEVREFEKRKKAE